MRRGSSPPARHSAGDIERAGLIQAAAAPSFEAPMSDQELQATQEQLLQLLRTSPTLTSVVAHDPSLLSNQDYVNRNNPQLEQFLIQHPDIARNPEYYLFTSLDVRGKTALRRWSAPCGRRWPHNPAVRKSLTSLDPSQHSWRGLASLAQFFGSPGNSLRIAAGRACSNFRVTCMPVSLKSSVQRRS